MISFLAAIAIGTLTGGLLGGLRNRRARAVVALPPRPPLEDASDPRLSGLPCTLGDVVLLAHGEEAFLSGALLLRERVGAVDGNDDPMRTAAALFVGLEVARARAVYARPDPAPSLEWMWPLPEDAITIGAEPPSAVEHEGERFERVRRLPLALASLGEGVPELGDDAVIGEYDGASGARLLVIIGTRATRVWRGRHLEAGMYDVLPGASR